MITALALGGLLRIGFLPMVLGQSFRGDEPAYWKLAVAWAEHGVYTGQWPPLHAGLLATLIGWFGESADTVARIVTTALSVWTGAWLAALATRAHSKRAGVAAAWIWALYLPLVPFAHLLLSEGLVLALLTPAVTLLLGVAQARTEARHSTAAKRLVLSGILLGGACLTRESALLWLATLTLWAAVWLRGTGGVALRRAGLVLVSALLTILPWSLSVSRDQGAFQLLGRTAGLNAYFGWNLPYVNFDLVGLEVPESGPLGAQTRTALLAEPEGAEAWAYEFLPNVAERNRTETAKGMAFIRAHPGFFLRSRIVKAADLATPLSFMTRNLRLPPGTPGAPGAAGSGGYGEPLASSWARLPLLVLSLLMTMAVAALGALGGLGAGLRRGAGSLIVAGLLASAPLALFVAMSRFRVPFESLLAVPAAAAIVDLRSIPTELRRRPARLIGLILVLAGLACLWILSWPCVITTVQSLL